MDDVQLWNGNPPKGLPAADERTAGTVGGGFKAGKRRRTNSPLKRKRRETVTVYYRDYVEPDGTIIALDVAMVTYKRNTSG